MEEKNIIAIEIGSSKIKGALGSFSPSGVLTVKAVEEEPLLDWVRYGAVSNVEETSRLVSGIIRKIENRVAPSKVSKVYVGLGGRSCCSMRRDVETQFNDDREITDDILRKLRDEVAECALPDRDLYAVVPRQYTVDKRVVARPKGTVGRNVRFSANLITCRVASKRNIDLLFNDKLNLTIGGYEVRQLALGDLVLTSDEKHLGCMLVDFGAETTTVSIYKAGHLQYMTTLPMGSRNITRDITTPNYLEDKAEELKRKVADASGKTSIDNGTAIDYSKLNEMVSYRAGEIIANIRKQIELAGYRPADLSAGIIIVGRAALLSGFNDRLKQSTQMKLRVGSITTPEIRIANSGISAADDADVLSVLYKAAVHGAQECLETNTVELLPGDEDLPDTELLPEEPVIDPMPEPEPQKKKKKGLFDKWSKIRTGLGKFLDEPEEDEDDAELSDDPD